MNRNDDCSDNLMTAWTKLLINAMANLSKPRRNSVRIGSVGSEALYLLPPPPEGSFVCPATDAILCHICTIRSLLPLRIGAPSIVGGGKLYHVTTTAIWTEDHRDGTTSCGTYRKPEFVRVSRSCLLPTGRELFSKKMASVLSLSGPSFAVQSAGVAVVEPLAAVEHPYFEGKTECPRSATSAP
jgi:hypothetical protein